MLTNIHTNQQHINDIDIGKNMDFDIGLDDLEQFFIHTNSDDDLSMNTKAVLPNMISDKISPFSEADDTVSPESDLYIYDDIQQSNAKKRKQTTSTNNHTADKDDTCLTISDGLVGALCSTSDLTTKDLYQKQMESIYHKSQPIFPLADSNATPQNIAMKTRRKRTEIMTSRRVGLYHKRPQVHQELCLNIMGKSMTSAAVAMTLSVSPVSTDLDINVAEIAHQAMQNIHPVEISNKVAHIVSKHAYSTSSKPKKSTVSHPKTSKSSSISNDTNESMYGAHLPTGNDPESRRQRVKIRNRLSAQRHRQRKLKAVEALQNQVDDRNKKITDMQKQIDIVSVDL